MMLVGGINAYLTTDPNEADEFIKKVHVCRNCKNFIQNSLFSGTCNSGCASFAVDFDNVCECFMAKKKIIEYWLCKMGAIWMEYSGLNDELRLFYTQENK